MNEWRLIYESIPKRHRGCDQPNINYPQIEREIMDAIILCLMFDDRGEPEDKVIPLNNELQSLNQRIERLLDSVEGEANAKIRDRIMARVADYSEQAQALEQRIKDAKGHNRAPIGERLNRIRTLMAGALDGNMDARRELRALILDVVVNITWDEDGNLITDVKV